MRSPRVFSLNEAKVINFLKENGLRIFLTVTFVFGVFLGVLVYSKNNQVLNFAKEEFSEFLKVRSAGNFSAVFFSAFLKLLLLFGAVFISGTSVVGTVLSPCVLLWQGFYFGVLATHLYAVYALKGIAFNAILLIPSNAVFALVLIFSSQEAMRFALLLTKNFTPQGVSVSIFENFKIYCKKFSYFLLLTLFSALADGLLSTFFIKFFNF